MEDLQIKINSLNALLPQQVPFVVQQITTALKLIEEQEEYERALDIAIEIATKVNEFSQGDILYNYTPILLALLQFAPEDADLSAFDTVNHDIPIGVAQVKHFMSIYADNVKNAPTELVSLVGNNNVCMVVLASMLYTIKDGCNTLPIAYIIMSLNLSHVQFINESFYFYCQLLTAVNESEF